MNSNRIAEKLVENIRRVCREKDVSIMRMENDLGFSSGLISRWNKTKTCPSFDKIVDIMEYLDVTYDELMGNIKSTTPARGKEKVLSSENNDDKMIIQMIKGSISGDVEWERAERGLPFELNTDELFPDMLCYNMHRVYYAIYKNGWFLLSVQYNEETVDVLVAVYMLAAVGMDMVRLDVCVEDMMKLLKIVDEEIFKRINQARVDKMKKDLLAEDFLNEYRNVS